MVTSVVIDASLTELRRLDAPRSEHRDVVVRLGKLLLVVQGHRTVYDDRLLATRQSGQYQPRTPHPRPAGRLRPGAVSLSRSFLPAFEPEKHAHAYV